MRAAIVDTGPLVAFLDRTERHHGWVAGRIEELDAPLLVCEPVLAEAMHLLARSQGVATLANAFHDDKFIKQEVEQMCDWLRSYTAGRRRALHATNTRRASA